MNNDFQPNKAQKTAITHGDGPLLIVAGAGTGKTQVITSRFVWLVTESGVAQNEILALTFTEKAAREMEDRVLRQLPYGYLNLWISTFHAFGDKILRQHALDVGLAANYRLLNETETWLLVRKNLDRFHLDYYRPLGNPTKFIYALIKHFSRCQDEGVGPSDYLKYAEGLKLNKDAADFLPAWDLSGLNKKETGEMVKREILRLEEIANAYHVYQQVLLENNCCDFGDLINFTVRLFQERPLILARYRQQFKYILVDEFQDTNSRQYELLKLLAAPRNNLTVVGDDDQSIYKFRGASISNIMQFKEDFSATQEVVLTENYRSGQEILNAAYKFIVQNNPYRLEVKLGIDKKLQSLISEQATLEHLHANTVEEEAGLVAQKIIALQRTSKLDWSSFAILVRANDSAQPFLGALEQATIPYQFYALRGLYNKPIIVDIFNYFKLLDNYHESTAVFRILSAPFLQLAYSTLAKITYYAKKKALSLFEALKQATAIPDISATDLPKINKILTQIESDSQLTRTKRTSVVLLNFLYQSGYLDYWQTEPELAARESLSYLQQFFQKIQEFEKAEPAARLADFLALVQMELDAGETGQLSFDESVGPEMVRVMSIHSAKGLEFDYVFVVNLVDRKFPTDERRELIEIPDALIKERLTTGDFHLEEERRLFYVAMTRAKRGLFFTSAENYGGGRKRKLSQFLLELGYSEREPTKLINFTLAPKPSAPKRERSEYFLPRLFSFSQMQTYETCPLRYKFSNVLQIPVFGNCYFSFGTTVHETLKLFLQEYLTVGQVSQGDLFGPSARPIDSAVHWKRLLELYDASWVDEWYQNKRQKEEYYQKGKELLKLFYERLLREKPVVKMLEQNFRVAIAGTLFSGRIDRIDEQSPGHFVIIDYKTGSAKSGELSADDKRQLLLYQIATEEVLGLPLDNLSYYYLEADKLVSFLGTAEEKQALKDRFAENVKKIKAYEFGATPRPPICQQCDYRDICESKKLS